ncbi:MAG: hypothetical protein ACJA19_001745, partial [Bacteroidia bacterium]
MNKVPLLSNRFKKVGWVLLIVAILFCIADSVLDIDSEIFTFNVFRIVSATGLEESSWFTVHQEDISYTLFSCLFIGGGLLIMFSKERAEDEFIQSLRMNALMWSIL